MARQLKGPPVPLDAALPASSILIVDDRPANLLAMEAILSPLGQRLVTANSGEAALRRLLDTEFAVILMDVQMPGMDGFQTARIIKERERTRFTPIIFVTAISRDAENTMKGYSEGAVDYITKPFDPEILRSKVKVFVQLEQQRVLIQMQEEKLREQERAETERRNERRFRDLADAMPLGVVAAALDGEIAWANRRWRELTGTPGDKDTAYAPRFFHSEDEGLVKQAWQNAILTGGKAEIEVRMRRPDGAVRWHDYRLVAEHDENGSRKGWVVTAMDVDARKRAEAERAELLDKERAARESAETANRTKDEFLATVSHELRTPLNAILGWIRMLRAGMLDETKSERALETIERNAQAQSELIEDILDVSRIANGKMRLKRENVKIWNVVQAAIDTVRPAALARKVTIEASADDVDRLIVGDEDRLQQVVWNLVANAIKFSEAGGHVSVRVEGTMGASDLALIVKDDGQGISKEFLPYVFDRFRQGDATTTRTQGGLGLGLAIVRHLVEEHGGTIRAESAGPGKGSVFTVRLPIRALRIADPAQHSLQDPRGRPGNGKIPSLVGLKILFVDDQPDARELLTELFRHYGATVTAVENAEKAVRAVEELHPDVLVSDIGMPTADGYGLIKRVRALPAGSGGNLPAIALTGFARAEDSRLALAAGFQVHMTKPVEPGELVALVASLAGR